MSPVPERRRGRLWPMLALFLVLLVSLGLMSDATQGSARFGQLYSLLLLANTGALIVLVVIIVYNLARLLLQMRRRAPGARLTARLVVMFSVLAILPVSIVYYFSLQFLQQGIDSWFDAEVDEALQEALELSRSAFDVRLRDRLHLTERLAKELTEVPGPLAPLTLFDLRVRSGANELALFGGNGRIIAASSAEAREIVPERPSDAVMLQLRHGNPYVGLDPIGERGLHIRAVVPVPPEESSTEVRILQALYAVPERLSEKASVVETAYARYKELSYLRVPLRFSFTITLSLVLVISLLSAVWAAFFSARRLVAPVQELAAGTQAVAAGEYGRQLPVETQDELGFLVRSFNAMSARIARARDETERSRAEVETQRAYLHTVLDSLSSGVVSLDAQGCIRTLNAAAARILGVEAEAAGESLDSLADHQPELRPLISKVLGHIASGDPRWSEQVALGGPRAYQALMLRGARLPEPAQALEETAGGQVLVFDDITRLIQAQRDAAWGEVARRLAHEIKNPLTPIQLSAERLRRRLGRALDADDAELLARSTDTIVQQVETMKAMVNAFSEYARAPELQPERVDLDALLRTLVELYRDAHEGVSVVAEPAPGPVTLEADPGRLRQLLHNLLKNAVEALSAEGGEIRVGCTRLSDQGRDWVTLRVRDDGPGFDPEVLAHAFEPYVTTKQRGTGLGLAIVKKIVEEHHGQIELAESELGGAEVRVRLPVANRVPADRNARDSA